MPKRKKSMRTFGSRAEVYHGSALKTTGGLRKKDLIKNKRGRIVSKKMAALARRKKHLIKAGYTAKKGKFGYVRIGASKKQTRKRKRKKRQ